MGKMKTLKKAAKIFGEIIKSQGTYSSPSLERISESTTNGVGHFRVFGE